jgi:hypothetical protein
VRDGDHTRSVVAADELDVEPVIARPLRDESRDLALSRRARDQLRVDRVDADELLDERRQLGHRHGS